jgi:diguanylate cyclase (GGDEF)-like protein/PAS domain S-box-containing protein
VVKRTRSFGLVTQLLVGFAAGGLFVALLLLAGDRMLEESSHRLERTLDEHVRPLARLHRLQSELNGLRNLELELSRLRDVFQTTGHVIAMRVQVQAIDRTMGDFANRLAQRAPAEAERLSGHWQEYRIRLDEQMQHAEAMNLVAAEKVTATGSFVSFMAIQTVLGDIVRSTEASADTAYRQALTEQKAQRTGFMMLALLGSMALVGGLAYSGRVVVRRVGALRDSAMRLATGDEGGRLEIDGGDEIADLGVAFNAMRDEVLSREAALRSARNELEDRVATRTLALHQANQSLTMFSQAVEQSPVGILIATIAGRIEFVNAAYTKVTGHAASALVGRQLGSLFEDADRAVIARAFEDALARRREWEREQSSRRADGSDYWEHLRLVSINDEQGVPAHLVLTREDISERRQQEEKIAYQAHYDSLTGLPNRVLALDRLVQVAGRARRDGGKAVAMFIDLDNFKQINDTLGHAAGDQLLQQAAARLKAAVRDEDTVARLGGDEFLVIMAGIAKAADAERVAEKIIRAFVPAFRVEGRELGTSPSIGLAVYPDDGSEPSLLLRNADLAMYEAKEAGRNTYRFFNQKTHEQSLQRLEIGRCLRGALERGELRLEYQPLIGARSGETIGSEALLRWRSPELGEVTPDRFIPIAEQNGLIVDIGAWVMREACACLVRWGIRGSKFLMAVNVSPRQFRSPGFVDTVRRCLEEFSIPPHQLEIEVTEGLLLSNQSEVGKTLSELAALGVGLSMDDFGTGYSSLSYLREFPFKVIKIDRGFVHDISADEGDRALVVAAVRMAKALGLRVIAEGVETDAQWAFLADQDCDVVQGYRFSRAVPETEFEKNWLGDKQSESLSATPIPIVTEASGSRDEG